MMVTTDEIIEQARIKIKNSFNNLNAELPAKDLDQKIRKIRGFLYILDGVEPGLVKQEIHELEQTLETELVIAQMCEEDYKNNRFSEKKKQKYKDAIEDVLNCVRNDLSRIIN